MAWLLVVGVYWYSFLYCSVRFKCTIPAWNSNFLVVAKSSFSSYFLYFLLGVVVFFYFAFGFDGFELGVCFCDGF